MYSTIPPPAATSASAPPPSAIAFPAPVWARSVLPDPELSVVVVVVAAAVVDVVECVEDGVDDGVVDGWLLGLELGGVEDELELGGGVMTVPLKPTVASCSTGTLTGCARIRFCDAFEPSDRKTRAASMVTVPVAEIETLPSADRVCGSWT
ncbi:hypothetical protein ACFQ9X_10220 [Catenulispora yoronensis]